MKPNGSFQDKVVIVTGGASGIGAALVKHFAQNKARVVIADRQAEVAESLAVAIRSSGAKAVAMELDVRELSSMTLVVQDTVARWGAIDYFFNNAGIGIGGDADAYSHADWTDALEVNLHGVVHGIEAVYPIMIEQQHGHIINTASVAGLITAAGQAAYSATKHAVVGLSKALRLEAKRHGIRVSVLCPGVIRTPILQGGKFGRIHTGGGANAEKLAEMFESLKPMDPDVMAPKVAAAVARNEMFIVVPTWWKWLWYLERVSPELGLALAELGYKRLRLAMTAPQPDAQAGVARAEPPPQNGPSAGRNLS